METVSNINKLTAAIIRILILTSHGVSIEATITKPNELATPVSNRTLILIVLLLVAGNAAGQEPAIRTQTTAVLVPTLVKGGNGKLVHGLRAEDFSIDDDGVPQMIQLDEVLDVQPVSIVIAIQRGRSASNELSRMQGLGAMLNPLIDQGKTDFAIVDFDSHVNLACDFTKDGNLIKVELKKLKPGDGGAAILDAVNYSVTLLNKTPNQMRVLLLISETRDHGSKATLSNVAAVVANSNIVMHTLAFSPALSQVLDDVHGNNQATSNNLDLLAPIIMATQGIRKNIPKAIAAMTGGEYELFKSAKGFDDQMNQFDNHLYNRYLLSFQPNNPHSGLHRLRVRLKETPHSAVLARSSYWVPPEPSNRTSSSTP
jgi:VWFA-related protein